MKHEAILTQVKDHIQTTEKKRINKGEYFNIFNVLKIETDEVRTHNRFIAELLNPKGKHLQKDTFLQLFYDQIESKINSSNKKKLFEKIRKKPARVKAEYWLGKVDQDNKTGGYIDICIITTAGQIRIENKIYAGEQELQLQRYCHDHERKNIVFFLTRFGRDTESKIELQRGKDYFLLSHENDTVAWLENCLSAVVDQPILHANIKQYTILIKKLTGKITSKQMDRKIDELLLESSENFESAKLISDRLASAVNSKYEEIINEIETKLKNLDVGIELKIDMVRGNRSDGGFIKLKEITLGQKNYDLGLNIELGNNYCFYCIVEEGSHRNPYINTNSEFDKIALDLKNSKLSSQFEGERNGWNLCGKYHFKAGFNFKEYLDQNDNEIAMQIGEEIAGLIQTFKNTEK